MSEVDVRALPVYGQRGRIAWLIQRLDMSQEAFGQEIGRSRETVNKWVNSGQTTDKVSASRIAELARERLGLQLSWEDFFEVEEDPLLGLRESIDGLRNALVYRNGGTDPIAGLSLLVEKELDREAAELAAAELEAAAEGFLRVAGALRTRLAAPGNG